MTVHSEAAYPFSTSATAGNASIIVNESMASGGKGGDVAFNDFSSASNAVFVLNSASEPDRGAGTMLFIGNATAANAIFTLNGSHNELWRNGQYHFHRIFGDTARQLTVSSRSTVVRDRAPLAVPSILSGVGNTSGQRGNGNSH